MLTAQTNSSNEQQDSRARDLNMDARWWQLGSQVMLLLFGVLVRDFSIELAQVALTLAAAMATQAICSHAIKLPKTNLLSPLNTALSLALLLRSDTLWIHPLAASLSIASKFIIRFEDKHIFNPSVFGIIAMLTLTNEAWLSPGQWGHNVVMVFWFALLGLTVVRKVGRIDMTFGFLASLFGMKLIRILYLGDRFEVLLHQFDQGALIVFAFFMITDPKTTPNARIGRITFAFSAAAITFYLQHWHFLSSAPVYALAAVAPLVPLMDRVFPALRFNWNRGKEKNSAYPENRLRAPTSAGAFS